MPDLSRRSFLGGILAVGTAATLVRSAPLLPRALPMLWGDGLHDDTAALNALLSGGEFEVSREGLALRKAGMILLREGNFLVSDTISIGTEGTTIVGGIFQASPTFREGADMLRMRPGSSGFWVEDICIEGNGRVGHAIRDESLLGGAIISPYISPRHDVTARRARAGSRSGWPSPDLFKVTSSP